MIFIALCLIVLVILLVLFLDTLKPKKYPPGPKFLPIVGNYLQFSDKLKSIGYHHLVFQDFSETYGDVVGLKLGRNYVVAVFGPDAVREILTREEFDGRPDGFFFRLRTFGKRLGIVFSDGPLWKKQRKFSMQHLRNFGLGRREMEEKIQEEIRSLMEILHTRCDKAMYMHKVFDISVLNVLWSMMAGERFDINDERLHKLLQIISDAFKLVDMSGGLLNQMPFLRFIVPGACGYTQLLEILTRMWEFLEETIVEHKRSLCESSARDLIDAFLHSMRVQSDETFTDDQLMSLCLDLFMAGAETTSNTLSFACIYMLLFPDVQRKVQAELDLVVGRNRLPQLQDRSKLKYTEAVLMEIQRRANIPPLGIAHRATKDTELMGYRIPQDTMILTSLYSVHMDQKYWKDPFEFRPERFLDELGNLAFVNDKYFLPFGVGKRRCLGESLGKSNLFLFFTTLLHNFNLEISVEDPMPQLEGFNGVTISPKPFKALLVPRGE